jgi:hypothetical protein
LKTEPPRYARDGFSLAERELVLAAGYLLHTFLFASSAARLWST